MPNRQCHEAPIRLDVRCAHVAQRARPSAQDDGGQPNDDPNGDPDGDPSGDVRDDDCVDNGQLRS